MATQILVVEDEALVRIVTSGKRLVEVTDLQDGSMFFSKPYQLDAVSSSIREMVLG